MYITQSDVSIKDIFESHLILEIEYRNKKSTSSGGTNWQYFSRHFCIMQSDEFEINVFF